MRKTRKNDTAARRSLSFDIIRSTLPFVSNLYDEYKLRPTPTPTLLFYQGKVFFENGAAALECKNISPDGQHQRTITILSENHQRRINVVPDLMEE